ncbi:hypothetical protein BSAF29S_02534 [Bacillus safensis subsp. safensis]
MKRIILACAAGMSTSIVVSKMKAAAEAKGLDYYIYAIPEGAIADELEEHGRRCTGDFTWTASKLYEKSS